MERAIIALDTLRKGHRTTKKDFYRSEKLMKNYEHCIQLCKTNLSYLLCHYTDFLTTTKRAIVNIKIDVPECSEIIDYTDIIYFTEFIENDVVKKLPHGCTGVIPNFTYVIGDMAAFEKEHSAFLVRSNYSEYYSLDLNIPFIMD